MSKTYKTRNGRSLNADNFGIAYPHLRECVLCDEPSHTFDMLVILGEGVCVLFGLFLGHMKLGPKERKEAVMDRL